MSTSNEVTTSSDITIKENKHKDLVEEILSSAGISINGNRPYDIQVKNENFYRRLLRDGSLGLGESYMDGWWECEQLDEMIAKMMRAGLDGIYNRKNLKLIFNVLQSKIFPIGRKSKAFEIGQKHYDIGNDLYLNMLDKRMLYTCAYWPKARTLDQAQEDKLELVCRKLGLKPGMKVLDLGCGWGSFAKYAAEKYEVKAVGITVSKEQVKLGRELCAGLPVELRLQDYRELDEKFDCIAGIGILEHVCYPYYRTLMKVVHRCLEDEGLFLLHTIGGNISLDRSDPWVAKYIFPNSMIPSVMQIGESSEGLFIMEDWHNFGPDYDKTLLAWFENFDKNWPKIKSNYDERFYRMWKFWLLLSAGSFRARTNQLWQIVLSKKGIPGGYPSIR
jgi:cyclopropane-fatty-acyl-phospholipid synthase